MRRLVDGRRGGGGVVVGAAVATASTEAATTNAYNAGVANTQAANANAYNAGVAAGTTNAYAAGYVAGATNTTYVLGGIYPTLPAGCMTPTVNGVAYYLCGNNWFLPSYGANGVYYRSRRRPLMRSLAGR